MKRKTILFFLCIVIILSASISGFSAAFYVIDSANLLTVEETADLEAQCRSFHNTYGMDLAIVTVDHTGGKSTMAYADDYFEEHFGNDGILLLICMGTREWYISTSGKAIDAFHDNELMGIEDSLVPYLSDGEFYDGFRCFLSDAAYYADNAPRSEWTSVLFMTIPGGAVISGIILLFMRASMNTKNPQHNATNYETSGSYHLSQHQDLFLYSNISKRPKPQNNNSGSSTHRSSSGRTHGGHGGKF